VVLSLTLLEGEKIIIGGLVLNILKKLNGLKFTLPSASTVLAKAIGLGAIAVCIIVCNCCPGISCGRIDFIKMVKWVI